MGSSLSSQSFKQKYHLQKVKLGEGSFGVVWRGVSKADSKPVAVKQMEKVKCQQKGLHRVHFEREIGVMRALNHENVTRLYDIHEDSACLYMVLEYCDGSDFGDKIAERGTDIPEKEVATWMRQMCMAVAVLHDKGICHRDIKPDNFMVNKAQLKLADFGLAVFKDPQRPIREKCGTPAFMAPEIHTLPSSPGYGLVVDDWAVGVCMFMVMTGGLHPFVARSQIDLRALLSGQLSFPWAYFGGRAISGESQDLCKRFVTVAPQNRLTCKQALQHPFIKHSDRLPAAGTPRTENPNRGRRYQWMFADRQLMPGVPLPKGVGFHKIARLNRFNWSSMMTAEALRNDIYKHMRPTRRIRIHTEGCEQSETFGSQRKAIEWVEAGCPSEDRVTRKCDLKEAEAEEEQAFLTVMTPAGTPVPAELAEALNRATPDVEAALASTKKVEERYTYDIERLWMASSALHDDEDSSTLAAKSGYRPGDQVHVWSKSQQTWALDGVVEEIASGNRLDGIIAGSVRVLYMKASVSKWIPSHEVGTHLRSPSSRGGGEAVRAAAARVLLHAGYGPPTQQAPQRPQVMLTPNGGTAGIPQAIPPAVVTPGGAAPRPSHGAAFGQLQAAMPQVAAPQFAAQAPNLTPQYQHRFVQGYV
eukprot:TRINITY_DN106315_c0_g1_i1.p1 TRINITY_DN106315_c0_g1~~TRINITY_DN106315_c0_g1_i1.p1  ORF type:complete len:661 (-),score=124.99 TRINITY_DN106315_c0_g1_i1:83-2011(-)